MIINDFCYHQAANIIFFNLYQQNCTTKRQKKHHCSVDRICFTPKSSLRCCIFKHNNLSQLSNIYRALLTTQIQELYISKLKERTLLISQGIDGQSNHNVKDNQIRQICERICSLGIKKIFLQANNISPAGIASLSTFNFDTIVHLSLGQNKIGNLGCKYLSRASFKKCRQLSLAYNQIGEAGINHLSKAQWNFMQSIELTGNILSTSSIYHLMKANWNTLLQLYLSLSELTFAEVLHLLQMHMPIKLLEMNGYQAEKHQKGKLKLFIKQKNPSCNTFILQ